MTDDFTKIYGKNSFKIGMEYQSVNFNTLQPAYSRGQFNFDGNYAGVPNQGGDQTGRAQFLLTPTAASVPGGIDGVGGANQVQASNISKTYDQRSYLAIYFQDDLKLTPEDDPESGSALGLLQPHLGDERRPGQLCSDRSPDGRPDIPDSGVGQG